MTLNPDEPPPVRKQIAEDARRLYLEAVEACGPGALAYGLQVIRDEAGLLPTRRIFNCRREGHTGWKPWVEIDPRAPENTMPPGPWKSPIHAFGFIVAKDFNGLKAGQVCRVCRFQTGQRSIELYEPKTVRQLEALAARRRARKVRREMDAAPLFAQAIRLEEYPGGLPDEKPIRVRKKEGS